MPDGKPNILVIWGDEQRRDFFGFYATAMASAFLDTFKEFPPRHEPASFSIDHIVKRLEEFLAAY